MPIVPAGVATWLLLAAGTDPGNEERRRAVEQSVGGALEVNELRGAIAALRRFRFVSEEPDLQAARIQLLFSDLTSKTNITRDCLIDLLHELMFADRDRSVLRRGLQGLFPTPSPPPPPDQPVTDLERHVLEDIRQDGFGDNPRDILAEVRRVARLYGVTQSDGCADMVRARLLVAWAARQPRNTAEEKRSFMREQSERQRIIIWRRLTVCFTTSWILKDIAARAVLDRVTKKGTSVEAKVLELLELERRACRWYLQMPEAYFVDTVVPRICRQATATGASDHSWLTDLVDSLRHHLCSLEGQTTTGEPRIFRDAYDARVRRKQTSAAGAGEDEDVVLLLDPPTHPFGNPCSAAVSLADRNRVVAPARPTVAAAALAAPALVSPEPTSPPPAAMMAAPSCDDREGHVLEQLLREGLGDRGAILASLWRLDAAATRAGPAADFGGVGAREVRTDLLQRQMAAMFAFFDPQLETPVDERERRVLEELLRDGLGDRREILAALRWLVAPVSSGRPTSVKAPSVGANEVRNELLRRQMVAMMGFFDTERLEEWRREERLESYHWDRSYFPASWILRDGAARTALDGLVVQSEALKNTVIKVLELEMRARKYYRRLPEAYFVNMIVPLIRLKAPGSGASGHAWLTALLTSLQFNMCSLEEQTQTGEPKIFRAAYDAMIRARQAHPSNQEEKAKEVAADGWKYDDSYFYRNYNYEKDDGYGNQEEDDCGDDGDVVLLLDPPPSATTGSPKAGEGTRSGTKRPRDAAPPPRATAIAILE